ncbi:MAG: acetyl/propionyl/methylcrotonyl-CoA carboxylase subunit alpha [Pseudomonadota bacterium]
MTKRSFDKILIANRGEIACRVMRTASTRGISTVAVYSDADRDALHVRMADEAVHIGGSPSRESYLQFDRVLDAALSTGAQAIHPGYGFLSENAEFCRACEKAGIVFIGPPVAAIEAMGSKSAAKQIMEKAGVPLVPGYHGDDQSDAILKQAADEMNYPVLLKAVAGGGGKGMRQVWSADEFDEALAAARREAKSSFNNDDMLVEKYLTQPRHVEIQVFCDSRGNAVYLFERDCSVQRRHQKVIEEAPAPGMSAKLRQQMGDAAIRAAQAIDYEGAGTVEFLLDSDGSFYFMEMNTRLQVEHPVTEMITGEDLVDWQLRVAAGETLPKAQSELSLSGHAFEARIYAEDPDNDFLPVTGQLAYLSTPEQSEFVRVDTGVVQGDEVSVYYDPMIAKLVTWDESREKALQRLVKALRQYRIAGMKTNIEFLTHLADSEPFRLADLDTGFIEKHSELIFREKEYQSNLVLPLAALYLNLRAQQQLEKARRQSNDANSPWFNSQRWRHHRPAKREYRISLGGDEHAVAITSHSEARYRVALNHSSFNVSGDLQDDLLHASIDGRIVKLAVVQHNNETTLFLEEGVHCFSVITADLGVGEDSAGGDGLRAPMNGTMISLLVDEGAQVDAGDSLLVMEAMKMEHTIRAPSAGTVKQFYFKPGELVDGGAELLDFEAGE